MLLEQLLETVDFAGAVDSLASDFREKHGLGRIDQLGLVVPSVEDAAARLETLGIGPFLISSGAPVRWEERGEPRRFKGKLGLARHNGVDLELLEPGEGSEFYRQYLDPGGGIVVQHLGFFIKQVDSRMQRMNDSGIPTLIRGRIKTGPLAFDFAYMDSVENAGFVIELIEFSAFGMRFRPPGVLYHFLGRLEKMSGLRCIDVG